MPGNANSVLDLRKAIILRSRRHLPAGHQIELVTEIKEGFAAFGAKSLLPLFDSLDDSLGLRWLVATDFDLARREIAHTVTRVAQLFALPLQPVPGQANRHPGNRSQSLELVQIIQRPVELLAVVHTRAQHQLGMKIETICFQSCQIVEDLRSLGVPDQRDPQLRIGGMDGHMQRTDALAFDTRPVLFGEICQRDEAAVQHRIAEIIVHHIERLAHALRNLLDETERAGVLTQPDAIERGIREGDPPVFIATQFEIKRFGVVAARDLETDRLGLRMELKVDEIDHRPAIDRHNTVARLESELIGQRTPGYASNETGFIGNEIDATICEGTDLWGHNCSISV